MREVLRAGRIAMRSLVRNRTSALVVVFTLAVTIAAATVLVSAIDMIWHVIPATNRAGLVFVASTDSSRFQTQAGGAGRGLRAGVSIPDLVDWSSASTTVEGFAALVFGTATLTDTGLPLRASTARVSVDLLPMWGISPILGRVFRPDEGRSPHDRVTILTDAFWRNQFGGRADVLGHSVMLNGAAHTVVGILPPSASIGLLRETDLIVPLVLDPLRSARDERTLFVTARLKPGVTREQAGADLDNIARRLQREHPTTNAHIGAVVQPLIEASGMNVRFLLLLLGVVAALLLAMACANIANVILAQNTTRRYELAVRAALGASRLDGVKHMMAEHLLMSIAAGVLGVAFASWGIGLLRWVAGDTFGFSEMTLNARVLIVSVVMSLIAPLGFGLWPALRLTSTGVDDLKQGTRSAGGDRRGRVVRSTITGLQVAVAVVLMIQIGLLVETAWRLNTRDAGFDAENVVTFRVDLSTDVNSGAASRFVGAVLDRIGHLPGVASAGVVDRLPVADRESTVPLVLEGLSPERPDAQRVAAPAAISAGYLRTMRIPLLAGRGFTEADVADAGPVALVNEQAMRRYWGGRNPIGQRLSLGSPSGEKDWLTIVGIVGNVRNSDADQGPLPEVYVPWSTRPSPAAAVVVRADGIDPVHLVSAVRAEIAQVDKMRPIYDVATMQKIMADDLSGTVVLASMLGAVAFVSLCLAASGIYGAVAHSVSQRTREIGLRMALGALPGAVVRMTIRQGAAPVMIGAGIGLAIAIALANLISSSITEVRFGALTSYVCVTLSILAVSLVASYVPARRAARVNPLEALKYE